MHSLTSDIKILHDIHCTSVFYFLLQYFVRRDFIVAALIVSSIAAYFSLFASDQGSSITQLGLVCNFFTICFFASPLSTMVSLVQPGLLYACIRTPFQADIIKSQSTASMSFPLSIMSFLTTLSWTGYGYLIGDIYVLVSKLIWLVPRIIHAW
jgi:uncharacterized protein with PQ loop repeat